MIYTYVFSLLIHSKHGLLERQVVEFCENLYNEGNRSPHLLAYLIDVALENAETKADTLKEGDLIKRAITVSWSEK